MMLSMRTQTYKLVQDILVLIAYAINPLINAHASVCSKAKGLNGLSLHLFSKGYRSYITIIKELSVNERSE